MLDSDVTSARLRDAARAAVEAGGLLYDTARDVTGLQWEQAPADRTHESEARRSPGSAPADPTADAALDARRLRLRRALRDSETLLLLLTRALEDARAEVDRALGPWDGDTP